MSVQETHMSAGFFIRQKEDGSLEVLLMEIQYQDGKSVWKPPSGTSDPDGDATPFETLDGAVLRRGGFDVLNSTPLHKVTRRFGANSDNGLGPHAQWWFLIDSHRDCSLRRTEIIDGRKTICTPMWVPVREALGNEGDRAIADTHRQALEFAIEVFWFLRTGKKITF